MKTKISTSDISKMFMVVAGAFIYCFAMNYFIVPAGLYTGGLLGIAQIVRTGLIEFFGIDFNFDISGIISLVLNIPVLIFTYKTVGRQFIIKTLCCIGLITLLLSVLPIPTELVVDRLACSIVGGLITGFGVGIMLRNGCSSGGIDVIGMYLSIKNKGSVGRISLAINTVVYLAAFAVTGKISTIVYTLIFAGIFTIALDRMHSQNIQSEVLIISKHNDTEIQDAIMKQMRRGVSYWEGYGAFTGDYSRILYTVVSKYELTQLKKIVAAIDPHAFISVKNGVNVTGNFEKRL